MIIKKEINIDCAADKCWAYLTEFEKMQIWNVCLLESQNISSGDVKSGFKSKVLMKEGKKSVWYENEILQFEPHTHLKIALKGKSLGKNRMLVTYNIIEEESAIKINYECSWEPKGIFLKLFSKQIEKAMDKNATNDLQELKNKIENH